MAVQLINIGNVANDGTGDDLREAFIKANANFEELDLRDDEKTSVSNLGDVGEGLFVRRDIFDLEFKKIAGSTKVTVDADDTTLTILADIGLDTLTIDGNTGSLILDNVAELSIVGGSNVNTTVTSGVLTIDYTGVTDLESDPTPKLSQSLNANGWQLLNVGNIFTSGVNGPVTGNVVGNITSTGTSTFTNINVNSGSIDNTSIGISTPQSGSFTSLSASSGIVGDITGSVFSDDSSIMIDSVAGTLHGNLTGNVLGNVTGSVLGNLTGDVLSGNGTQVLNAGTDGTDANYVGNSAGTHTGAVEGSIVSASLGFRGDVKANNGAVVLGNGSDGTDARFVGNLTGNVRSGDENVIVLENGTDGTDAVFTGDVTGNVTGLVHGVDVRSIAVEDNLDIGGIIPNINSTLQFFLSTNGINYGTITSAASISSDFGTLA